MKYPIDSMENQSRVFRHLKYALLLALVGIPILSQVAALPGFSAEGNNFSPLQIILGVIMMGLLFYIIPNFSSIRLFGGVILPMMIISLYSLSIASISKHPIPCVLNAFRYAYPCVIFLATYLTVKHKLITAEWLINIGLTIIILTLGSQLIALYQGIYVGYYNTEYATSGFNIRTSIISQIVFSTAPIFFLFGSWRVKETMGFIASFVAIGLSMRRTAFVSISVILLFGIWSRVFLRESSSRTRYLCVLFPCLAVVGFISFLSFTNWGEAFSLRLADKTGAGRNEIFKIAIDYCLQRDIFGTIFGEGYGVSNDIIGAKLGLAVFCHNDYLETFISLGLVGFLCLLSFFYRLIKLLKFLIQQGNPHCDSLLGCIGGLFVAAFTDGGNFQVWSASSFALLGFIAADIENEIIQ